MKSAKLSALAALLLVTGCSQSSTSTDITQYPTVVIDEQHQMQGTNTPAIYQIRAGSGIRLETAKFQFKYGTSAATPNMIQVVLGKSQLYKLTNPTVTNLYIIDRTTLKPLRDEAFRGFASGDSGLLMVGRDMSSPEKESVHVSWVGKFEVK
jgi:hypothetical protein